MRPASLIAFAFLFMAVSSVVAVHGGVYGNDAHSHGGEECVIAMAGDRSDNDLDVPTTPETVRLLPDAARTHSFSRQALIVPTVTSPPPGRAPPLA